MRREEGRIFTCTLPSRWEEEIAEGCVVVASAVYLPPKRPGLPERVPFCRVLFGWTRLRRTPSSGVWVFRRALRREQVVPALFFFRF